MNIYIIHSHQPNIQPIEEQAKRKKLTLRSAPALELNLVAVTTLLFLGSTAPTATSGVSTTATIFGGAVNIAARPNRTGNNGPPGLGEGLIKPVGVRGPLMFKGVRGVLPETLREVREALPVTLRRPLAIFGI
jgi:hypothetical protein